MALIRKYAVFTKAQQEVYENLNEQQRSYIDFRAKGNNKADAYRLAYKYGGKNAAQCAKMVEKRNPEIGELVDIILNDQRATNLESAKKGELNNLIDVKAKQKGVESVIEKVEGADSEEAKRIQFYRDISNGKIKSKKEIVKKDRDGNILYKTVEEKDDVSARMNARKELDRILGLNKVIDLDQFEVAGITIKVVDATKKTEKIETSQDNIDIDKDNIVEVPDEEVESDE